MPEGTCSITECDSPSFCRGWCTKHYRRWYKANRDQANSKNPGAECAIDGCREPARARGWCPMHYSRWKKHGDPLYAPSAAPQQSKPCEQCGTTIVKTSRCAEKQWERKRYCSRQCRIDSRKVDDGRTKRQRWEDRNTDWGAYWERQRQRQDKADLNDWEQQQAGRLAKDTRRCMLISARPVPRVFIGSTCRACGGTWVQYANRVDSDLCSGCTKRKWRMNDRQRARHYGVAHEHIDRFEVFASDQHRCQICHRKTKGKYPDPRSATIDHIIPLSRGGPDLRHNVQTACLGCNVRKHNGSANDQMRLHVAA